MIQSQLTRERFRLTQAALAIGIGSTQGNIGHYENKNQTIPSDVVKRLIASAAKRGVYIGFEDIYGLAAEWTQGCS